jgi:uncharacterized C2H2 Zn-finger protein
MSILLYHCSACEQSWTESELESNGSLGEYLFECPGCGHLEKVSSQFEADYGEVEDEDDQDGETSELATYHCDHCDQSWTQTELEEEETLGEWLWGCPGCGEWNKDD